MAEQREDLWAKSRNSTGLGARLVTGSGFIYRFDVATGSEGAETTFLLIILGAQSVIISIARQ